MDKKLIKERIKQGGFLIEEAIVKAKDHFNIMKKIYNLAVNLSKEYPGVAYLICVTHIEGLARLKYPNENKVNKRFKDLVKNYGGQNEDFNKEYTDWLWKFYRCYLVHEWGILETFFDNKEKSDYGIVKWPKMPQELAEFTRRKGSIYSEMKYIKTKKILEITRNCIENLEKEFNPTEKSKIIHRIKLKDPVEEELVYIR